MGRILSNEELRACLFELEAAPGVGHQSTIVTPSVEAYGAFQFTLPRLFNEDVDVLQRLDPANPEHANRKSATRMVRLEGENTKQEITFVYSSYAISLGLTDPGNAQEFLNNPTAQDTIALRHLEVIDKELRALGFDESFTRRIANRLGGFVDVDWNGLKVMAHHAGADNVALFFKPKKGAKPRSPHDGYEEAILYAFTGSLYGLDPQHTAFNDLLSKRRAYREAAGTLQKQPDGTYKALGNSGWITWEDYNTPGTLALNTPVTEAGAAQETGDNADVKSPFSFKSFFGGLFSYKNGSGSNIEGDKAPDPGASSPLSGFMNTPLPLAAAGFIATLLGSSMGKKSPTVGGGITLAGVGVMAMAVFKWVKQSNILENEESRDDVPGRGGSEFQNFPYQRISSLDMNGLGTFPVSGSFTSAGVQTGPITGEPRPPAEQIISGPPADARDIPLTG